MNEILHEINCPILEVPDLSGRYAGSVTNVAVVPACIAGIKIEQFLKGLEMGYKNFSALDNNNRALEFSTYIYNLYKKNYKVIFSMPYSKNLEGSTGLWVQGISESTGKDERGLIGTYQEAPICQHSVLEYLLGGTKGIVIPIIWTVEDELLNLDLRSTIDYVNGRSAQTIINYQADATFQALIQQGVPSAKISIKDPSEESMGILVAFILSSVYYLCLLIDVNWANNPKVIIGKQICNKTLKDNINREKLRNNLAKEMFRNFF
jgi:glucose-6-phosphate isomerase